MNHRSLSRASRFILREVNCAGIDGVAKKTWQGTDGSNPSPSSGESSANRTSSNIAAQERQGRLRVPGPRPTRVRGWRRAGAAGPDRRSGASPPPTAWEVSSIRPMGASHSHIREGLSDGLLLHPHTIVSILVNDLADIDNEVFLFLDDYHPVTDPAIRGAVSFLLRYAPSHLHLVLTTRLEPPLSLGGLLAKN